MRFLERAWYEKAGWLILLWPFAKLFELLSAIRKRSQSASNKDSKNSVPVVVVGNITVGGTGKTPLIIQLGKMLLDAGLKPGVISRGYLGKAPVYPFCVDASSDPAEAGDEPVLIARSLACPVVIDPNRRAALDKIVSDFKVDVVLSDDGLQHYALPRDIEIIVVDGQRLFGNEMCLPAGPLREPLSRLEQVKYVLVNGQRDAIDHPALATAAFIDSMPTYLVNLQSEQKKPFRGAAFNIGATVHAVTGIGNPNRFFDLLSVLPYEIQHHEFPDHHAFTEEDIDSLNIDEHSPIVMTEKDAVKCKAFARPNFWYLRVKTKLPDDFQQALLGEIKQLCARNES